MASGIVRRTFFKYIAALSAFGAGSILSFKKKAPGTVGRLSPATANAMEKPDYAIGRFKDRITIDY